MDRKDEGGIGKMRKKSFLSPEEISQLQHFEATSSKEQKRTAEQIEAIYSSGQNISWVRENLCHGSEDY